MASAPAPVLLPSGRWRIRWLDHAGQRKSATFPSHNEARAALARNNAETEAVKLGIRRAVPAPKMFEDLRAHYMATRALRKRSRKTDECILRVHLIPAFGGMKLRDITYERIEQFKAEQAGYAPQTLRHHLNLLGAMLKHAFRLRWILEMPPIDRPSVRTCAKDFAYLRTAGEVKRFLRAARDDGDDAFSLYATALYTGMRQGELAALTWDNVDFDNELITVDRSFHGPTKADDVRHLPIQDALLPILRAWRLRRPGPLVFCNLVGNMLCPSDRIFRERLHDVLDAAGFVRPTEGRRTHYITFHDLRHTFASHWMMNHGDLFRLQKILGHKSTELTLRYAHLSPNAFAGDRGRFDNLAIDAGGEVLPIIRSEHRRKPQPAVVVNKPPQLCVVGPGHATRGR